MQNLETDFQKPWRWFPKTLKSISQTLKYAQGYIAIYVIMRRYALMLTNWTTNENIRVLNIFQDSPFPTLLRRLGFWMIENNITICPSFLFKIIYLYTLLSLLHILAYTFIISSTFIPHTLSSHSLYISYIYAAFLIFRFQFFFSFFCQLCSKEIRNRLFSLFSTLVNKIDSVIKASAL